MGFDTNPHDPDFARRFPNAVKVVDTAKIEGQIAMFDRLLVHDETPKVVDVQHRCYDRFFETIGQIGFMEEARRAMVQPVALFHVDASADSLTAASALAKRWPKSRSSSSETRARRRSGPTGHSRSVSAFGTFPDRRGRRADVEGFRRSGFFIAGHPQGAAGELVDGDADKLEGLADADFSPISAFRIGNLDGEFSVSLTEASAELATKVVRPRSSQTRRI